MKSHEQSLPEFITVHLNKCKKYIDTEVYDKALAALQEAQSVDPRNIYIIALVKQVHLLSGLKKQKTVDKTHTNKIRTIIPELVQRAIDDSRKRERPKEKNEYKTQLRGSENEPDSRDRTLALDKLKSKFIKLAEESFNEGDYQNALGEIGRIFIIDPGNADAKEFEKKIKAHKDYRIQHRSVLAQSLPYFIALLVVINVVIFFLTYVGPGNDHHADDLSGSSSDVVFADSSAINPERGQHQEALSPASLEVMNRLPLTMMTYGGEIPVLNESDDSLKNDSPSSGEESRTTDYAAETERSHQEGDITVEGRDPFMTGYEIADSERAAEYINANVHVIKPESIVHVEQPVYPAEAIEQSVGGTVVVRVLYNAAGTVDVSFVESSDHPLLSESALIAARLSRFAPADTSDFNSSHWVSIQYDYRLDQ